MERRLLGILLIVLLALATAAPLYAQQGAPSGTGPRRVDPGIRSAGAVIGLERTTDNRVRKDQAKRILPMMKVLRGMKMADREAGDAVALQIWGVFTQNQKDALLAMREARRRQFEQQRAAGGAPGGAGGPATAGGPGGFDPARLVERRKQLMDQAVKILETRAK
ncbi:MAG: hypothetical protein FJX78_04815 [Armatimonadetes bacterium]|nr:hypothetical protein [Armatimonadota bacterium]